VKGFYLDRSGFEPEASTNLANFLWGSQRPFFLRKGFDANVAIYR